MKSCSCAPEDCECPKGATTCPPQGIYIYKMSSIMTTLNSHENYSISFSACPKCDMKSCSCAPEDCECPKGATTCPPQGIYIYMNAMYKNPLIVLYMHYNEDYKETCDL